MRILFLGDVVGRPGRRGVATVLPRLVAREGIDFVVANGENAAGGRGISARSALELRASGIDVITSGNHLWQHRDIIPVLRENDWLIRPLNMSPDLPGGGWTVGRARRSKTRVAVINLLGRVFMNPADCPFRAADSALESVRREAAVIIVDMHAEATSEKVAMGHFLAGRVSAVLGTHTHVQTADERILAGGTAYVTDAGMCGPCDSVLGMRTDRVLERFRTQMPVKFEVASGPVVVEGMLAEIDGDTGHASSITRVRERFEP